MLRQIDCMEGEYGYLTSYPAYAYANSSHTIAPLRMRSPRTGHCRASIFADPYDIHAYQHRYSYIHPRYMHIYTRYSSIHKHTHTHTHPSIPPPTSGGGTGGDREKRVPPHRKFIPYSHLPHAPYPISPSYPTPIPHAHNTRLHSIPALRLYPLTRTHDTTYPLFVVPEAFYGVLSNPVTYYYPCCHS